MNYFKLHLGDYAKDAAHLSLLEDGIYSRMLRIYYATENPFVTDMVSVFKRVGALSETERDATVFVLSEFFELQADGYHNKRADAEIAASRAKATTNRENGQGGGRPLKINGNKNNPNGCQNVAATSPRGLGLATLAISHKPLVKENIKRKKTPAEKAADVLALLADVDPQVVADWKAHREKKRASITPTVIAILRKQAADAGLSLEAVLKICCANGWTGYRADWDTSQAKANGKDRPNPAPWWSSDTAVIAKGKALGIEARAGETIHDLKTRINQKIEAGA